MDELLQDLRTWEHWTDCGYALWRFAITPTIAYEVQVIVTPMDTPFRSEHRMTWWCKAYRLCTRLEQKSEDMYFTRHCVTGPEPKRLSECLIDICNDAVKEVKL